MVVVKLPSGKRMALSKCEAALPKSVLARFDRCIKHIEEANKRRSCTPRDIKLRRKGCVNPYAVCRVSVLSKYCPTKRRRERSKRK